MNIDQLLGKSEEVSSIMKHLSHPKKLALLCNLIEGEKNVGELFELVGMSQPQTSQYLKQMEGVQILSSRREGIFIYYNILDKRIFKLMKEIKKIFC